MKIPLMVAMLCSFSLSLYSFDFVIVKYKGGDYYNAREGVKNFVLELKRRTSIDVNTNLFELSLDDKEIFLHHFIFINGHIPLDLNDSEKRNLRQFVLNGGFVFANDDYGMDESFRKLIKTVFPDNPLQEVSFDHPIYQAFYHFREGLPKIHEHYDGPPKAFGIFIDGRIGLFYDYNSDIADGWDPPEIHNDPEEKREQAFQMGINIAVYSTSY